MYFFVKSAITELSEACIVRSWEIAGICALRTMLRTSTAQQLTYDDDEASMCCNHCNDPDAQETYPMPSSLSGLQIES